MIELVLAAVLSTGAGTTAWYPGGCGGWQPGFHDPCEGFPEGPYLPVIKLLPWLEVGPPAEAVPHGSPPKIEPGKTDPLPGPGPGPGPGKDGPPPTTGPAKSGPPPATPPATAPGKQDDKKTGKPETGKATLQVDVLADAQLFLNGQATTTTGQRRLIDTPGLAAGKTYQYVIRAEVVRNGKTVQVQREVVFQRGDVVQVSLRAELSAALANRADVAGR